MVVLDLIIPLGGVDLVSREYVRRGYESLPSTHIVQWDGSIQVIDDSNDDLFITVSATTITNDVYHSVREVIFKKFNHTCHIEDIISTEEYNIRNVYLLKKRSTINKTFPDFYWLKERLVSSLADLSPKTIKPAKGKTRIDTKQ